MENSTFISEMLKFYFGSKVVCSDGESGIVSHIGLAPQIQRLTHIGVRLSRFFGKTVFIPFSAVVDATGEGVSLSITRAELATASSVAPGGALLDSHTVVQNADTPARGTLKLVAVQPRSGELAYAVVHNLRSNQDTLLRANSITGLDAGKVAVSVPEALLQTLPPYRSDEELQREVESILFDLTPLHVDFPGMNIRVLDSVLYLDGNISSSLRSDIVQDQVLGVQGLLEVKNRLVGDDQLAADLAMALGRDPRTRDLPIGVYPRLGVVRLSGAVHDEQQRAAAAEIASSFQGVRSVVNDLIINPNMDLLRVMSSSAGGEAEDKVPGRYIRHTK